MTFIRIVLILVVLGWLGFEIYSLTKMIINKRKAKKLNEEEKKEID